MQWQHCELWADDGDEGFVDISSARNEKRRRTLERGDQGNQDARNDEGKCSLDNAREGGDSVACFGDGSILLCEETSREEVRVRKRESGRPQRAR